MSSLSSESECYDPVECRSARGEAAAETERLHPWPIYTRPDRSDIPRYLVQSDFEHFPFQSGRIMARIHSVGMTQYFQMSVKRGYPITCNCISFSNSFIIWAIRLIGL